MGNKIEVTGILENPDGYLWLVCLAQSHSISAGIEEFEGKLVKVTRWENKIIIEVIHEPEPISLANRELCIVGG